MCIPHGQRMDGGLHLRAIGMGIWRFIAFVRRGRARRQILVFRGRFDVKDHEKLDGALLGLQFQPECLDGGEDGYSFWSTPRDTYAELKAHRCVQAAREVRGIGPEIHRWHACRKSLRGSQSV